jgi:hypothetical protein
MEVILGSILGLIGGIGAIIGIFGAVAMIKSPYRD